MKGTAVPTIPIPSAKTRLYLYGVITALIAVLVGLKIVDPTLVPAWLALGAAVLAVGGTGTAGIALGQQLKTGEVEPSGTHTKDEQP